MTHFATALLAAITASNCSLREVARRVGIDSALLSRLQSGLTAPSASALSALCRRMNPEHFAALGKNHAPELLRGYLLDCAVASGLNTADLHISLSKGSERWDEFPSALVDRLYQLGKGALHDKEFAVLLADLEPLALKLQAANVDSTELSRLKRGVLYQFPQERDFAVAEEPPKKNADAPNTPATPPVPHPENAS